MIAVDDFLSVVVTFTRSNRSFRTLTKRGVLQQNIPNICLNATAQRTILFKNGDLAPRVRALVFSAWRCCRRSRVSSPSLTWNFSSQKYYIIIYGNAQQNWICTNENSGPGMTMSSLIICLTAIAHECPEQFVNVRKRSGLLGLPIDLAMCRRSGSGNELSSLYQNE
jgi:hypothetical protein